MTVDATAAFLARYVAAQTAFGRPMDCPPLVWAQAQVGRDDTLAVIAELVGRPDWEVRFSYDAFVKTLADTAEDRPGRQLIYMRDLLSRGPPATWLRSVEGLMVKSGADIEAAVWPLLVAWIAACVPNPKLFFARDDVLPNVPADIDLAGLSCPNFPDMASTPLVGGRAA